jgi:hypothetical protein
MGGIVTSLLNRNAQSGSADWHALAGSMGDGVGDGKSHCESRNLAESVTPRWNPLVDAAGTRNSVIGGRGDEETSCNRACYCDVAGPVQAGEVKLLSALVTKPALAD